MKRFLNHVRSQPDHIREFWAGACTLVVALIVFTLWFKSFKQHTFALLNPDQQTQEQTQYFENTSSSLFGTIGHIFSDGKNQIANIFSQSSQSTGNSPSSDEPHR